jgi:uncharacterized protein YajQ (UPF0234 family)
MPSFDITSEVDMQEVLNAVDQVRREVSTRYDLKDSKSTLEIDQALIILTAPDKMTIAAVAQLLREKLAKRKVSLKSVEFKEPAAAGGDTLRQEVIVKQALTTEELKKISKAIKDQKFKVNAQIQGEQLRVSGKKRDDLQNVIAYLRSSMTDFELQFTNFRE